MYAIYANEQCIYNDASPDNAFKVINPILTMADNSAGSLTFTLTKENPGYSKIQTMTTEIIVKRDGKEIWSGRVLTDSYNFMNCRELYCEGELAYLNDTIQPPAEYHGETPKSLLEKFIAIHNEHAPADHQFVVRTVTVTDPNDSLYRYTNYETTMDCLMKKLVEILGGHFIIEKIDGVRYLDYLADYPKINSQQIEFGKNLLDFSTNFSMEDFVTVLVPLGESMSTNDYSDNAVYEAGDYCQYGGYIWKAKVAIDSEPWTESHWTRMQKYYEALTPYLDVTTVNNGSIYVTADQEVLDAYGWIIGTHTWNDVTEPSNLLTKAQSYLKEIQFHDMELEVNAFDLHYLGADKETIELLDQVRVISRPHGLDLLFPVTQVTIHLDEPSSTIYTLNSKSSVNISTSAQKVNDSILSKIEEMPSEGQILAAAKLDAANIMNVMTNGYVTIVTNQNGSQELLISEEKDYKKAKKLWRWNVNGLAYSKNGYEGPYEIAMTMDGSIVADAIKTGTLSCDRLNGGIIKGQKIEGGTIDGAVISVGNNLVIVGDSSVNPWIEFHRHGSATWTTRIADIGDTLTFCKENSDQLKTIQADLYADVVVVNNKITPPKGGTLEIKSEGGTLNITASSLYVGQNVSANGFFDRAYNGYSVVGANNSANRYQIEWDGGTGFKFFVDGLYKNAISDERLKKDIRPIVDDYLKAVGSVDMVQFRLNRDDADDPNLRFGIIAQRLVEAFAENGLDVLDTNILKYIPIKYGTEDKYYAFDYEQFLTLRLASDEHTISELQNKISELETRLEEKLNG